MNPFLSFSTRFRRLLRIRLVVPAVALGLLSGLEGQAQSAAANADLARALTFHASFDRGLAADFGMGDRDLRHAPSMDKRAEAKPGLPTGGEVQLAEGAGRFGNALRFTRKQSPLIFFPSSRNMDYRTNNWSGTVSFWLSVDPKADLEMSYCDPIQITPRAWNDAAFFVEFEKRTNDVPFRLGAYPDFKVWNPQNRKWDDMSAAEKPLVTVPPPTPFARGRWTHVVFTFENFNTGRADGAAKFYLDGRAVAMLTPRQQTFSWEEGEALVMLGVGYVGLWDELALFNRALSSEEVGRLYALSKGAAELHR